MSGGLNNFFRNILGKKAYPGTSSVTIPEIDIPSGDAADYAAIIGRVLPYFAALDESNQKRFLKRVYNFRRTKHIHFSGMEPREEIALLVCAAAVQVSFGLKNYLLPYFTEIYILNDAYHALDSNEAYIGHVSPTGIYISWKYFVQGFANYSDGVNVALHEMAHALHHENFIDQTGIDWEFRKDFEKLTPVFGPLVTKAILEKKSYLRGYAFTNFHEFWAVCVEYFFEKSEELKTNLPELYSILCITLNQDPLRPGNPVLSINVS